jgi:hypothetical protein
MSASLSPIKMEFHLGADKHGRRVTAMRERGSNGEVTWTLARAPHDQRDDSPIIRDLPDSMIRLLGEIAGSTKL